MRGSLVQFFRPTIRDEKELIAYVLRTCIVCAGAALAVDVINQLIFFESWETALRS